MAIRVVTQPNVSTTTGTQIRAYHASPSHLNNGAESATINVSIASIHVSIASVTISTDAHGTKPVQNHDIPGTNCTESAAACIGFHGRV
eukprot:3794136-Rhodomonas_salina.3